jgi:hypothetical protein
MFALCYAALAQNIHYLYNVFPHMSSTNALVTKFGGTKFCHAAVSRGNQTIALSAVLGYIPES